MHCSERTIQQIHGVVLSEQSHDSSKGQGERASVECPIVAGHLQDTVNLSNKLLGGDERLT
jgi:hypothetical protein